LELKSNFHPDLYNPIFTQIFVFLIFFQPTFTRFLIFKINTDKFPDLFLKNKNQKR